MYTRTVAAFLIALALVVVAILVDNGFLRTALVIGALLFIGTGIGYEVIATRRSRGRRQRRPPPV